MKPSSPLLLTAAALATTGTQAAVYTDVLSAAPGEMTHAEILSSYFGGSFTADGVNFTNGSTQVTRVNDDMDQTYAASSWSAMTIATWSGAEQSFGTIDDGVVFDVTGDDDNAQGQASNVPGSSDIAFARFGSLQLGTTTKSTNTLDNPFGNDYVVTYTYSVNGDPVENKYLLFFEDWTRSLR
ncbi:MAG: hypothetical protein KTR15_09225 [Phycisphaeraceae bacterium]|nr:hypothetical protein [Phycisphaeraceae bacterium]